MLELLPIGSVVMLKGGKKTVMIYGRKQIDMTKKVEYDYLACLYPEGFMDPRLTYLFNHNLIEEVLFKGFENDDEKEFITKLSEFYNNKNKA